MSNEVIKGYKAFNKDLTCRNFQYEIGKTYKHKGKIEACSSGFHFCEKLSDVYNYYSFDIETIICEVEGSGEIIKYDDKIVCSDIKVLRQNTQSINNKNIGLFNILLSFQLTKMGIHWDFSFTLISHLMYCSIDCYKVVRNSNICLEFSHDITFTTNHISKPKQISLNGNCQWCDDMIILIIWPIAIW